MLTILGLLLSFSLPGPGFHIPISCPQAKECQQALLSDCGEVLLSCQVSKADWFYSGISTDNYFINISRVSNVERKPEGELAIRNPLPSNTGFYLCQDMNGTKVTQYEIDFQDIIKLHITHKSLRQNPLPNDTMNLGNKELVYTQWEPWQRCNRCGKPGERKRLGFCYIQEPLEDPVPCGLYLGKLKTWLDRARPEMQVEACNIPCEESRWSGGDYVIFDNFRFMEESDSAWLTCPFASIYRPVQWEVNDTALTWLDQLSGRELRTSMNLLSGGQWLQIFQPGTYRCFVEQELVAQFNPAPVEMLEPERGSKAQKWQPGKIGAPPGKAESVLRGLKLTLLLGFVLMMVGLLGLLYKIFPPARGKRRS